MQFLREHIALLADRHFAVACGQPQVVELGRDQAGQRIKQMALAFKHRPLAEEKQLHFADRPAQGAHRNRHDRLVAGQFAMFEALRNQRTDRNDARAQRSFEVFTASTIAAKNTKLGVPHAVRQTHLPEQQQAFAIFGGQPHCRSIGTSNAADLFGKNLRKLLQTAWTHHRHQRHVVKRCQALVLLREVGGLACHLVFEPAVGLLQSIGHLVETQGQGREFFDRVALVDTGREVSCGHQGQPVAQALQGLDDPDKGARYKHHRRRHDQQHQAETEPAEHGGTRGYRALDGGDKILDGLDEPIGILT